MATPSGGSVALSAILLQGGLVALTAGLLADSEHLWLGALMIVCGVASFATHVRQTLARRVPRPPALPARDWSVWQVHCAFAWLLVALATGLVLSIQAPDDYRIQVMWIYGVAGLVGFLAQMVAGMQGRLVPLYAWYRAYASTGAPPFRAANTLPSERFARAIFLSWATAVPLLAWGLAGAEQSAIRTGAALLLLGVGVGGAYLIYLLRQAREAAPQLGNNGLP